MEDDTGGCFVCRNPFLTRNVFKLVEVVSDASLLFLLVDNVPAYTLAVQ